MRALVVDDSRAMRAVVGRTLRSIGVAVSEAGDGREGLERIAGDGPPDVVLVDWNMPTMNGLEFIRAVRSAPTNAGVRILMITSETEVTRISEALEAGTDEYMMKPFTADALQDKLLLLGALPR